MELAERVDAALADARAVEIVPDVLFPHAGDVAVADGCVGVRRSALLQAYVALARARQQFNGCATLLAVLAAPENVTAWNARKAACTERTAHREWHVTGVLLSSHTEKLCKSPLAWYHRRWLAARFALPTPLEAEFRLVLAAAERHASLYVAWGHLRWACARAPRRDALVPWMADACRRHLSDASVWAFAFWLESEELRELARELNARFPHDAMGLLLKYADGGALRRD